MAEANDGKAIVPSPEGSGLLTSNLDAEFKMLKSAVGGGGLTGSALVDMPRARLKKMASQFGNMRPGLHRQAPSFYHPLFEALNLQLPTKTREINQWSRHFYKCMAPGTLVLMADGTLKEIEKIVVGEAVITHDGTVGTVNETFEKKVKTKVVRVSASGLPMKIIATRNHPFMVLDKDAEKWRWGQKSEQPVPEWRYGVAIKKGDFLLTPQYAADKSLVDLWKKYDGRTLDSGLMRLIGYYAAEGCVSKPDYSMYLRFSLNTKERDTIGLDITSLLKSYFGGNPKWYDDTRGHGAELRLWNQPAAKFFLEICPGNARTKRLDPSIMRAGLSEQIEFLRAFVLGDGFVNRDTGPNPGQIVINLASRDLSSQIQQMFIRCGMAATIYPYICKYKYKDNGVRNVQMWQVRVAPLDAERLIGKVKEAASKSRNNSHHWFCGGKMVSRIKKVETIEYDDYVYNLNVGPNNSFVANGVIVHNTDGYVGTVIDMHSDLPMTGAHLVCDDEKVKLFFEILFFDILKGLNLIGDVSHEWWKLGNVFPFGEWDDDRGIWTGFNLLNPDFVEVEKASLVGEPILKLDPDDNLKRIVASRQPKELYEALAKIENGQLVNLVARGEKIPLNKFRVSHLAYKMSPYESVGTPIMFRAFKPLIFKDLVRRVQQAVYERHITPIKLVKVGTDTMPANPQAVTQVREAFDELSQDLSAWFVYHHAISVEYVSSAGKIHPFDQESKWIREEIMAALMGSEAMIGGTGPNFASGSIGLQVLINRYMRVQEMLARWIKDTIFRPVAIAQDFKRRNDLGEDEYIVPDIEFEFMKLKDDVQMKGLMKEMAKTGLISKQTFYTYLGLDYRKEKRQIERERAEEKKAAMQGMRPGAKPAPGGPGAPPPIGGGGGDSGGGEGPVPGEGETAATVPTPGEPMPAAETIPGAGAGQGLPEAA